MDFMLKIVLMSGFSIFLFAAIYICIVARNRRKRGEIDNIFTPTPAPPGYIRDNYVSFNLGDKGRIFSNDGGATYIKVIKMKKEEN
jgi:hypothetical protein